MTICVQQSSSTVDLLKIEIREATIQDVKTLFIFQKLVFEALADKDKPFFLLKSENYLSKHFNTGGKAVVGYHQGRIVAQALIVHPSNTFPTTEMTDMKNIPSTETLSIIQGVSVHPAMRGQRLGSRLVDKWFQVAHQQQRHNCIAETAQDNEASVALFTRKGVLIVSEGVDLSDGTPLYNHHKTLQR